MYDFIKKFYISPNGVAFTGDQKYKIKQIMTKLWIKNGVFASDIIELNGCVVCNLTEDMLRQADYEEYVEPLLTEKEKLEQAKVDKIAEITAYDTSSSVNRFILNGLLVWLDKVTRVGLINSTTIERDLRQETTELWLGKHNLIIKCDLAIQLLQQLEVYALKCFNVTAIHKKEVNSLSTIEKINSYDITKDYPKNQL